jgi:hypothetical protein
MYTEPKSGNGNDSMKNRFEIRQRGIVAGCVALLLGAGTAIAAPGRSRPDVPDTIKAPADAKVVFHAWASGVQIYVCQQGTDGKAQWTLKAPEADLRNRKGAIVGHHSAGPTWKHKDGSEVTGKAAARVDSPQPDSIPWLLVTAVSHSGDGVLAQVTTIQRVETKGGIAPPESTCDASKLDTQTRVPYSAQYYFYTGGAQSK